MQNVLEKIRSGSALWTPDFEPGNGNAQARILFLMQDPGPRVPETGVVSQHNPDPTARNFKRLLDDNVISYRNIALWNVYPYFRSNQRLAPTASQIEGAFPQLQLLVEHMPNLKHIVCLGRSAQRISKMLRQAYPELEIHDAFHTSQRAMNQEHCRSHNEIVFKRLAVA